MKDNELLELAAKAAGYDIVWCAEWPGGGCYKRLVVPEPPEPFSKRLSWAPLIDDGDALRLAVTLNISIHRPVAGDSKEHWGTDADTHDQRISLKERDAGDPMQATRRAVVRAAAEIALACTRGDAS